jgi:hypothetical protein
MSGIHQTNSVAKGPVLYCLEELSIRPNGRFFLEGARNAIADLAPSGYRNLGHALAAHLVFPIFGVGKKSEKFMKYLNDYWLNPDSPTCEFVEQQPVCPVFGEGLVKTIDLSLQAATGDSPKPIDTWWIVDHPKVEMINLVSKFCVTLLVATPRPLIIAPRGILNVEAEAWSTSQTTPRGAPATYRISNIPEPYPVRPSLGGLADAMDSLAG